MTADSTTMIDRDALTIDFHRTLKASREDVFDAWTQPDQLSAWWDPTGARLVRCVVDLRPGGAFRFENDGHGPPFEGVYRVLERPSKLVFEAMGATGTVELVSEGRSTAMHVSIRCASREHFEQLVKVGVDVGTARTLDNLVTHLHARG